MDILSLIIDVVLLVFLSATLYVVYKFADAVRDLKHQDKQFQMIVKTLSQSIDRAEQAVHGMKQNAAEVGQELEKQIFTAKSLADELYLINQAGNSLADRLEGAATKRGDDTSSSKTKSSGTSKKRKTEKDLEDAMQNRKKSSKTAGSAG